MPSQTTRRLLERFRAHPLWAEIDAAERHSRATLRAGRANAASWTLLYRVEGRWTMAEFKTDRLADADAVQRQIEAEGYDQQVTRYVAAVQRLLGERPRALLIFLNVAGEIQEIEC